MKSIFTICIALIFSITYSQGEVWNYTLDENCPPVGTYIKCAVAIDEGNNYYPIWAYRDTSLYILYSDTFDLSRCEIMYFGAYSITGANIANWNTAHSWGNHASAGYLTTSSITGKLNISDTASMLSPYAYDYQLTPKLNKTDTTAMLAVYMRTSAANATFATIAAVNARQPQLNGIGLVRMNGTNVSYDNTTYLAAVTAGTGISISGGSVVTNTAPDQTVAVSGSSGITVTGTYPNFTVAKTKRQETYIGTTNGSGVYSVTYATAFSSVPCLSYATIGGAIKEEELITSTTTGFSINVQLRTDLIGLLPTYANVSGRTVNVTVTEM